MRQAEVKNWVSQFLDIKALLECRILVQLFNFLLPRSHSCLVASPSILIEAVVEILTCLLTINEPRLISYLIKVEFENIWNLIALSIT